MEQVLSLFTALGIQPSSQKGSPGMEIVWPASSQSTLGEEGSQSRFALEKKSHPDPLLGGGLQYETSVIKQIPIRGYIISIFAQILGSLR